MATRKELETRLIAAPDDVESYLVYADLLQAENDPRGELIVLQHEGKAAEANALIDQHIDHLLGPLKYYSRKPLDHSNAPVFHWHLGFIRGARLSYESNYGDPGWSTDEITDGFDLDEVSLPDALGKLLQHPSGMLLSDLSIPLNMLDDGNYFEPVIKVLAEHGAPTLQNLKLGEDLFAGPRTPNNTDYNYEISWTCFGDMGAMWARLPRLERFTLLGSLSAGGYPGPSSLGAMEVPTLRHLELMTGGMDTSNVQSVAAAHFPEMRHLDLWFGDDDYGFTGGLDDIEPILTGKRLPKLKHLGLMNAMLADDICALLARAAILPQLEELSLALGTVTDAGAQALADTASAFAHLKVLDLEHNYLTAEGIGLVENLCPDVRVGEQRELEDEYRYVCVAE